jgi:AraC-like DNA-binding protein
LRAHILQAQEEGFSPEAILEGSGVSWNDVDALEPLDLETIANLFDHLSRRTPAGFAVRAGRTCKVRNYGIVGFATMSVPTLRDAFELWSRHYLVTGDVLVTSISEKGDEWRMHFEPRCRMTREAMRFAVEAAIAAVEPVVEELTHKPASTLAIDFSADQPRNDHYSRVFNTSNLRFDQRSTSYCGTRTDLDRPIPSGDRSVSDALLLRCNQFEADLTRSRSVSARLEDMMRESEGSIPSLDQMARALRVSPRWIQRALQQEGMGYQQLVQNYRVREAKLLLADKRASIKTIAYTLGFKDTGSFRRAFLSWTGKTVGAWQRDALAYGRAAAAINTAAASCSFPTVSASRTPHPGTLAVSPT